MSRAPFVLPREIARTLAHESPSMSHEDWVEFLDTTPTYRFRVLGNEILYMTRWGYVSRLIIQDENGSCWGLEFESGATEIQDQDLYWGQDEYEFFPVRARERMVTIYERSN